VILQQITVANEQIEKSLNVLERLDFIRLRSLVPEQEFSFKHAITQDVVYNSLLKKDRQLIHDRIGFVIEKLFKDRLLEFYESLAFHFKHGASPHKAVEYLMKAGEKSIMKYALEESHYYFKEAFEILTGKPELSQEEKFLLIDLLIKWAYVFHFRGDWKGLTDLFLSYKDFARSLDDKVRLGFYYGRLGFALFFREQYRDSYTYLSDAIRLGEETGNQKVTAYACSWIPWICAELGKLEEGIALGERSLKAMRLFPSDPYLYFQSHASLGFAYYLSGKTKKVFACAESLLDYGQKNLNLRCLTVGNFLMAFGYILYGDLQSAAESCEKAIRIAGDPWFSQFPKVLLGLIYIYKGMFQKAEDVLHETITYCEQFGIENLLTTAKMYLGVVSIAQGRKEKGFGMIHEAQQTYLRNERKSFYVLSEYILGYYYLTAAERAASVSQLTDRKEMRDLTELIPPLIREAENHLHGSLVLAKEIQADGITGMVYLSLGLLYRSEGKTAQAKECLSEAIYYLGQCKAELSLKRARDVLASLHL
jgi:tetratricopeptide (TPR) repeat protein